MSAINFRIALMVFSMALPLQMNADNLLKNGGFEDDLSGKPPSGWVMWGPQESKISGNYTVDTANPKSGKASLRIYHPANTYGYIITSPVNNALRPVKGKTYEISFWVKSDKKGATVFSIGSYAKISPYVDGKTIGIPNGVIAVSPEWKQYVFTIAEGKDFFADSSSYIYFVFKPTANPKEAGTLWIDDVIVSEKAAGAGNAAIIDDSSIAYTPVPLRVSPGNEVNISVNPQKRLHLANKNVGGISFHRVSGWTGHPYDKNGAYTLTPEMESALSNLHLPLTRFYAVGDESFKLEDAIDKIADVLAKGGIPQETTVLEFEVQSADRKISPSDWARGVRYSISKGYSFKHWEIGNETYVIRSTPPDRPFNTADAYVKHFIEVSQAIRKVQPNAKIGISVDMGSIERGSYVLKAAAGHYDFVCPHWYGHAIGDNFEETVLGENYAKVNRILQVNALLAMYNKTADVYQYDTEWALATRGAGGIEADHNNGNANILGTVYQAVRLIYYTREKVLRGASSWNIFAPEKSPGFAVVFIPPDDNRRAMLYWLYYYYNRSVGDVVLDMTGTVPYYNVTKEKAPNMDKPEIPVPMTPFMVTADNDGKTIYIMAANGSWTRDIPCSVTVNDYAPSSCKGVMLTHNDINAHPMLDKKEDFVKELSMNVSKTGSSAKVTFMIGAHSVIFITLEQDK